MGRSQQNGEPSEHTHETFQLLSSAPAESALNPEGYLKERLDEQYEQYRLEALKLTRRLNI
ncbi:MAG: hypothetical protein AAGG02_10430 [Cyanobacteria bacterium P01_H01_bin.15]